MPVYIARIGAIGPVKIGHSEAVRRRLTTISKTLWEDLVILRLLEGGLKDERRMHQNFAAFRLGREWYTFSPAMMDDVGLKDIEAPFEFYLTTPRRDMNKEGGFVERAHAVREWMLKNHLTEKQVADMLGRAEQFVSDILRCGCRLTGKNARILINASGGELAGVLNDCLGRPPSA